jgi:hypothetical protein
VEPPILPEAISPFQSFSLLVEKRLQLN